MAELNAIAQIFENCFDVSKATAELDRHIPPITKLPMFPDHIRAMAEGGKTITLRAKKLEGMFYSSGHSGNEFRVVVYRLVPQCLVEWPVADQKAIAQAEGGYDVPDYIAKAKQVWRFQYKRFLTGDWQPWLHRIEMIHNFIKVEVE